MSVKRFNHDHGGRTSWMYECSDGDYVLNADYESLERQLATNSVSYLALDALYQQAVADLERVTQERDGARDDYQRLLDAMQPQGAEREPDREEG